MKNSNNDQTFSSMMFEEIIADNPILVGAIGLCPAVAICTSLKAALIMSLVTMLTMIVAECFSALFIKRVTPWARAGLYTLSGMLVVAPSMLVIDKISPAAALALGIYLPLLAVNPLIVRQCERVGVKSGVLFALKNAVCCALGYDAVLIVMGFIREFLGAGSIWGHVIFTHPAAGFMTPFGGFLILAFFAAGLRAYFKKRDPAYAEELAVNGRTAIKKPHKKVHKPKEKKSNIEIITLDLHDKDNKKDDIIEETPEMSEDKDDAPDDDHPDPKESPAVENNETEQTKESEETTETSETAETEEPTETAETAETEEAEDTEDTEEKTEIDETETSEISDLLTASVDDILAQVEKEAGEERKK